MYETLFRVASFIERLETDGAGVACCQIYVSLADSYLDVVFICQLKGVLLCGTSSLTRVMRAPSEV